MSSSASELRRKSRTLCRRRIESDARSLRTLRDVLIAVGRANTTGNMYAERGATLLDFAAPTPIGRPRGRTLMASFVEERATALDEYIKLHGRSPNKTQLAKRMGLNWWRTGQPTSSYWTYDKELTKATTD